MASRCGARHRRRWRSMSPEQASEAAERTRSFVVPSGSPTFGVGSADDQACDVRDHVTAVVAVGEHDERPVPVREDLEMCLPAPVGAVVPEPPRPSRRRSTSSLRPYFPSVTGAGAAIAVAIGPRIRAAAKRPMSPAVEQTPAAACAAYRKDGIGFPAASSRWSPPPSSTGHQLDLVRDNSVEVRVVFAHRSEGSAWRLLSFSGGPSKPRSTRVGRRQRLLRYASTTLALCDMRTLYLRNVHDDVVERLARLAARDATSVAAVAVRELADVSRR